MTETTEQTTELHAAPLAALESLAPRLTPAEQRMAACHPDTGVDPEIFYPVSTRRATRYHVTDAAAARAVCASCPIQARCLDAAMAEEAGRHYRWGIRGGYDEFERAHLAERTVNQARRAPKVAERAETARKVREAAVRAAATRKTQRSDTAPAPEPVLVPERGPVPARQDPTPAQARALLAGLRAGGRIPSKEVSGSTVDTMVRDGLVTVHQGVPGIGRGRAIVLTTGGHVVAARVKARLDAAARELVVGALAQMDAELMPA